MACSGTSRGFMNGSQKSEAVCRAGRRGERNRCAVRRTARGSAAPGMACRDRPVESSPQLGAFPAVGIPPRSGGQIGIWTGLIIPAPIWREGMDSPSGCEIMDDVTKGARPYAPLPPPPTAGWQIAPAAQGGTGSNRTQIRNPRVESRESIQAALGHDHNAQSLRRLPGQAGRPVKRSRCAIRMTGICHGIPSCSLSALR